MCIRDRFLAGLLAKEGDADMVSLNTTRLSGKVTFNELQSACLLYTSDAADERSSVDLGGRRIIKKKKKVYFTVDSESLNIGQKGAQLTIDEV